MSDFYRSDYRGHGCSYKSDQTAVWYLVQCKPRQDERAQERLERQGCLISLTY